MPVRSLQPYFKTLHRRGALKAFRCDGFQHTQAPGRPEGEAMGLRSVYRYLAQRFGASDE